MNPFTSGDNIAVVDGEPDLVYMSCLLYWLCPFTLAVSFLLF